MAPFDKRGGKLCLERESGVIGSDGNAQEIWT